MADYDRSVVDLLKSAIQDAQDLVRSEVALAKAELREEGSRLGNGLVLLAVAAVAGLLGLAFLLTTAAWALATAFEWPVWIGFAIVTGLMLLLALVLGLAGRRKLTAERPMAKTVDTMKENSQWIRARTS